MLDIVEISKPHNRKNFDCGQSDLNRFLAQTARQQSSSLIARTYVLVDDAEPEKVLGFYTLTFFPVDAPEGSPLFQKYARQLPALKLARLAIDQSQQGQGLGSMLLIDACCRAARAFEAAPIIGLFVDAKDNRAKDFYQPYGFNPVNPDELLHLWLPIGTVQQVAEAADG
ncbi:MAG: GNAT family N-acetyltransferase [Marinobacterium sp.]|nr:GNAT family N-acetyltransferase [Marinobacterium sp.]